jgi:D-tyrosyl-tRNA(Tyr) deacylase
MRAVVQRVSNASVRVDGSIVGKIDGGLLVLLGVRSTDDRSDADHLVEKILNLRIFEDAAGQMERSLLDTGLALLVVSQFTLYGDVKKGRRPSFIDAAPPERANTLYEYFVAEARKRVSTVETGRFQAMMDVQLVNSGPVTILIDSEKQF